MSKRQAHLAENLIDRALFWGGLDALDTKAEIVIVKGTNYFEYPEI